MMNPFEKKKPKSGPLGRRAVPVKRRAVIARTPAQQALVAIAIVVMVLALIKFPQRTDETDSFEIAEDRPAPRTITANFAFKSVDVARTQEAKEKSAQSVYDIYRVESDVVDEQISQLRSRIRSIHEQRPLVAEAVMDALRASTSLETPEQIVDKTTAAFSTALKQADETNTFPDVSTLSQWLRPDAASLPKRVFAEAEEGADPAAVARPVVALDPDSAAGISFTRGEVLRDLAVEALRSVLSRGVRAPELLTAEERNISVFREDPVAGQGTSETVPPADLPDPEEAVESLKEYLVATTKSHSSEQPESTIDWSKMQEAALAMARTAVTDTLYFDKVATAAAKERAGAETEPVMRDIQPGDVLQRTGDRWTQQSMENVRLYWKELQEQQQQKPSNRILPPLVAHLIFVGLVVAGFFKVVGMFGAKTLADRQKSINLGLLLLCAILVMGRIASYFDPSGFVLPVAAAAILFAILRNVALAGAFSLGSAILVSAQYNFDWRLLIVTLTMSLAGCFSIYKVRRRSDMTGASLMALFAGLLVMFGIILATDTLISDPALQHMFKVFLNGMLCLFVVPGLLSPLEKIFGITTDIQLLEYSDLNNEVLSMLAIEIPATYAHSLMLGQLAEAAADGIGANGLLARVSAYYHDIGKMRRPEYFSENQAGYNIHDELSPRLSARAIAAHVTYGAEMAREFHLPKPIIDGIKEHHGTTLIGYFYQQAVKAQKHGDVREEDFRYPGPRPQSRETAILMICDAVESGVRSIKNPNEERVREFVDKIIAARNADRQFDECNLTLKELDTIAEVVTRRMWSSLHTRVAYPDVKKDKQQPEANIIPISGRTP